MTNNEKRFSNWELIQEFKKSSFVLVKKWYLEGDKNIGVEQFQGTNEHDQYVYAIECIVDRAQSPLRVIAPINKLFGSICKKQFSHKKSIFHSVEIIFHEIKLLVAMYSD